MNDHDLYLGNIFFLFFFTLKYISIIDKELLVFSGIS